MFFKKPPGGGFSFFLLFGLSCRGEKLCLREAVGRIAEATNGLKRAAVPLGLLLGKHRENFLLTHATDGRKHPLTRAIATVGAFNLVKRVEENPLHGNLGNFKERLPCRKVAGNVIKVGGILLKLGNHAFIGKGEKLNKDAAGRKAGIVTIDRHTEGTKGGNLLTLGKIAGNVLGNFAAFECHSADVGLPRAVLTNDVGGTSAAGFWI